MDLNFCVTALHANARRINTMLRHVEQDHARFKPAPEAWSLVEVICHLRDEEREDFRVLIDRILRPTEAPEHQIDPQGWVTERRYLDQDLETALSDFMDAREASLTWLAQLDAPDWSATAIKPWGEISAGDVLAAWTAHDLLHMRQLVEIHYALTESVLAPNSLDYAGGW